MSTCLPPETTTNFRLLSLLSRSESLGLRCSHDRLVRNVGVRLPSHTVTSPGPTEDPGRNCGGNLGSSILASKVLDNGTAGTRSCSPVASRPGLRTLLVQPWSSRFHENPQSLHLHAWRLSQKVLDNKGSRKKWLGEWLGENFGALL